MLSFSPIYYIVQKRERVLMVGNMNIAKNAAAEAAASLVQDGMLIGLGTGSTAAFFIAHLIERCRKGLRIKAVTTSKASLDQAKQGEIPIAHIDEVSQLDLTVDGADQIDDKKQMIKGGGGALLREKIVAGMSREMIVIVDQSKRVKSLGGYSLPVEILPFAHNATLFHLAQKGFIGTMRKTKEESFYITENGNYIVDLQLPNDMEPYKTEGVIRSIPGVLETGLFLGMAGRVIIGYPDGKVKIWQ